MVFVNKDNKVDYTRSLDSGSITVSKTSNPVNYPSRTLTQFAFTDEKSLSSKETKSISEISFVNEGEKKFKNFYVNGILTSEDTANQHLKDLEGIEGVGDVELIYNESKGLLSDVIEANSQLFNVKTKIVMETSAKFKQTLDDGENIRVFAHSQGATITLNALQRIQKSYEKEGLSDQEIQSKMSKVQVLNIGGFVKPDDFPTGIKVINLENETDSVPKLGRAIKDFISHGITAKDSGKLIETVVDSITTNGKQAINKFMDLSKDNPKFTTQKLASALMSVANDDHLFPSYFEDIKEVTEENRA